jgi:cytochrome c biogenesis protein CcdA
VFFLAVPAKAGSGKELLMIAYRAGLAPRYYVFGLAASRAASFELPLQRFLSPSSIG